jgi:ankyrin repeat protein
MTRRKKALLKAAELGDVRAVKRLLKKRFLFFPMNVNYTDEIGDSPLIKATNRISMNQIFNTPNKNYKYDEEILGIAKLLLANGADVNANRKYGYKYRYTPLVNYIQHSDNENIIMLLLEHGADVNTICEGGTTALNVAAAKRAKHIVDLLLDHGADVKIGNNPIIHANLEITELLISRGADVNSHPEKEDTALIWAIRDRDDARMELLLSKGATVNEKGKEGNTRCSWPLSGL